MLTDRATSLIRIPLRYLARARQTRQSTPTDHLPSPLNPIFPNRLADLDLERRTVYVLGQSSTGHTPKIKFVGDKSSFAFCELSGVQKGRLVGDRFSIASIPSGFAVFIPAKLNGMREDCVELYCDDATSLQTRIASLGRSFAPATLDQLVRKIFRSGTLSFESFPEMRSVMLAQSEIDRRSQLRQLGTGLSGLYRAWSEEIAHCGALMNGAYLTAGSESLVKSLVSAKLSGFKEFVEQHVADERRIAGHRSICQVTLFGPPNTGKSSFLNLVSQKLVSIVGEQAGSTKDAVDQIVRVVGIPLVMSDTVGLQSSTAYSSSDIGIKNTIAKMDCSDLKICILDMETVYKDKSPNAIDKSILDAIDSDTIVLINKRDKVDIRIPAPPGKMRLKNSPLSPQGDVNRSMFRGRVPLRTDGDTTGNTIMYGDYGLRALEDVRLTEACIQECRATLHRNIKKIRGGRFWIRVRPDHPMARKGLGTRMGKGKAPFDHWEAKVPNKKIMFEIGGGVREDLARIFLKCVSSRLPGSAEFVVAPKEETVQEMCARIREYPKVAPLGVWCVSCKTGDGMKNFLEEFADILKQRYGQDEGSNGDSGMMIENAATVKMARLSECAKQLSQNESISVETIDFLQRHLNEITDQNAANLALKYLYHSKYGILKMKELQFSQEVQ